MNRYFEDIGQVMATFAAGTGAKAGQVCKVSAGKTVAACSAGDAFCGLVDHVDQAGAAVVLRGFVTVGYTSTAPSVGFVKLVANGSGGVKTDNGGASYLAVAVDTTAATVTILL